MNRLVALGAVLAFVSVCHTAPQISTVNVDHGNVGVLVISGATFGPGSFSVGQHGSSHRGQPHVYVNEDSNDGHVFIQATNHKVQQDNNRRPQYDNAEPNSSGGTNSGNTQLYPVKPLTILSNTGQGGIPGQKGSEGGSIVISTVVLPNHENNKENKVNKEPDALDGSAIEAAYASNSENNGFLSAGAASNSGSSIAIDTTGGSFEQGTLSINNKRPGANVPQHQSAANTQYSILNSLFANNGDNIGYQNTRNEAPFSIGHGVSVYIPDASALEAIFGSNSGNNELSSVGNGLSTGGQGNVAIGGITTGGQFGEGTLSLNNKRPGANVRQQQSAANNGDIGYQNTGNEATLSIREGVSAYIPDASALDAIFGSNSENKELSSIVNGFSTGEQESVAIGGITGGQFAKGTLSLNNKRPGANVPQPQGAANNENIGYQNTGKEATLSIGEGVSAYIPDASALEAIFGSNSENKELSSIVNGFSTGEQESVAIGAITGGQFAEGTLSLNNKRPGANVPQPQGAANNGNIGYQNTGNEATLSIGPDVSVYIPDASALEAIFGSSNSENNELSSVGNDLSTGGQGSVAIGGITGGQFGEGTLSLNNKRPGANVPQQQSTANNGDIGYQNTENEATLSIGQGVSAYIPDASALEAIFGSNSENKELSSVGNGLSTGGLGNIAIGASTGSQFVEGTLSLNNKKPGANVPQQQPNVSNENTGYHNTGNEAPRPKENGANSNGNGNAEVGYNDGQSSTGYNAYNNEEPWIWNR